MTEKAKSSVKNKPMPKICKHTNWAYSNFLLPTTPATFERICRSCGKLEQVMTGMDMGEDYRRTWQKFHAPGRRG